MFIVTIIYSYFVVIVLLLPLHRNVLVAYKSRLLVANP